MFSRHKIRNTYRTRSSLETKSAMIEESEKKKKNKFIQPCLCTLPQKKLSAIYCAAN